MKFTLLLTFIIAVCSMPYASGQNANKSSGKMITITGKVMNSDNNPVKGAVFYIDDVETPFRSKSNGSYKVKVSPESLILQIRMSEYSDAESLINGQTIINFNLKPVSHNPASKTEIKGKDKKSTDTGIPPVKPKVKKMNTYSDIYQMIRTEVPGVTLNGRNVQIQQGHSFIGSSNALIVVNGVIVNDIGYISPLDVKSITVLKRSEATIYGERGTNGVLVITLVNGADKNK
jgi:hypothetical protein